MTTFSGVVVSIPVGDQIRIIRSVRKLTQRELAQNSGLSQFWISSFETGRALPTSEQIQAIKDALDWPEEADKAFAILTDRQGSTAPVRVGDGQFDS